MTATALLIVLTCARHGHVSSSRLCPLVRMWRSNVLLGLARRRSCSVAAQAEMSTPRGCDISRVPYPVHNQPLPLLLLLKSSLLSVFSPLDQAAAAAVRSSLSSHYRVPKETRAKKAWRRSGQGFTSTLMAHGLGEHHNIQRKAYGV